MIIFNNHKDILQFRTFIEGIQIKTMYVEYARRTNYINLRSRKVKTLFPIKIFINYVDNFNKKLLKDYYKNKYPEVVFAIELENDNSMKEENCREIFIKYLFDYTQKNFIDYIEINDVSVNPRWKDMVYPFKERLIFPEKNIGFINVDIYDKNITKIPVYMYYYQYDNYVHIYYNIDDNIYEHNYHIDNTPMSYEQIKDKIDNFIEKKSLEVDYSIKNKVNAEYYETIFNNSSFNISFNICVKIAEFHRIF
jgi:hypothetical protein